MMSKVLLYFQFAVEIKTCGNFKTVAMSNENKSLKYRITKFSKMFLGTLHVKN